eukprot:m.579554 g.579554  ORF g.579554 m.579554 type:complete len:95 (-) comp57926_c0_seq25:2111-2395(-)
MRRLFDRPPLTFPSALCRPTECGQLCVSSLGDRSLQRMAHLQYSCLVFIGRSTRVNAILNISNTPGIHVIHRIISTLSPTLQTERIALLLANES